MIKSLSISRRSATAAAMLAILAVAPLGCKRHRRVIRTTEEAPVLATVVATADPQVARQLVAGFYGVEQNSWRWTTGRFSVLLRPPLSAATKGATLQLKFAIPEAAMNRHKAVALSAYVNGTPLPPETYTQAGQFTFSRDVPAGLLASDVTRVDFSVDKTLPPTPADKRELGVVVSMVGFAPKP
jgi:hypothetical protein